jgi:hypothetical protein
VNDPAPSWETIDRMERARWARLVRQHADHDDTCARLARQLAGGARLTAGQCAELGRLAVLNGWRLPVAGSSNGRRKRARKRR